LQIKSFISKKTRSLWLSPQYKKRKVLLRILFLVNDLGFFLSHRSALARYAVSRNVKVIVGYGDLGGADTEALHRFGIETRHISMRRGGVNPLLDIVTLIGIWRLFKATRPDLVHLITIKPYLFGGMVARLTHVPAVVSAVAGMGSVFAKNTWLTRMLRGILHPMFRMAFGHSNQIVLVQNESDKKFLIDWGVLSPEKARLIPGSGVDLSYFVTLTEANGPPVVCLASRLLRDKGIFDFVNAARLLRKRGIRARYWLAGLRDEKNSSSLSENELQYIRDEGVVEILGFRHDIPSLYAQSHIICLPSFYGEGLPKALVEAAAAGRAVVTTDHPGCRDAITPGVTGLIVPVKAPEKLAEAIQWLIEHPKERILMGQAGRKLAEREFAVERIVQKHWDAYHELLGTRR
jgi:glycosyltransferase involved in cell wall biosynthesis